MKNENHIRIAEPETNASAEYDNADQPPGIAQTGPDRVNRKSQIENSSNRSSTGKIARLPAVLRDQVNQWLDDGALFETISDRLAALGHPGITQSNISRWKTGGYQKYLRHQDHLDEQRIRFESAHKLGQELGDSSQTSRTCEILTSTRIYELLLSLDDTTDPEESAKTIGQICQLTRALGIHLSHRSRTDRLKFQERLIELKLTGHHAEPSKTPRNPDDPASEAERDAVFKLVDQMFGINLKKKIANLSPDQAAISRAEAPAQTQPNPQPDPTPSEKPESANPPKTSSPPALVQTSTDLSPSPVASTNPEPLAVHSEIQQKLPIPELNRPYPPGPIHQPPGTIPILNKNGIPVGWVPASDSSAEADEKPAGLPGFPDAVPYNNRQGAIICWYDNHRLPPGATDSDPIRGTPHHIPVLNRSGLIIGWSPEPDGPKRHRPSPTATPIIMHQLQSQFAWLEETAP